MTNLVKCAGCNLIVNELLCYVQQKISIADEETLVRICASAFTSDEIKKSKALLYESLPTDKRKIIRKSKGKEERDLADIISLFKATEPDDIPVFVARQLDKLPPILWDHLDCSKVLKDILVLKTEIDNIKINYATSDSVQDIKAEVLRIRNDSLPPSSAFKINTIRGAWLDSGPVGLSHEFINDSTNESTNNVSHCLQYRKLGVDAEKSSDYVEKGSERQRSRATERNQVSADIVGAESPPALPVNQPGSARVGMANAAVTSSVHSPAAAAIPQICNQLTAVTDNSEVERCGRPAVGLRDTVTMTNENNDDGGGWQKVSRRKQNVKYRFVGKSGIARDMERTFKAAKKKNPIFYYERTQFD